MALAFVSCYQWAQDVILPGAINRSIAVFAVLAYFIAAISPNMDVANGALPAYIVINLFFVGLLIRPQDQPKYWHWCAPTSSPIVRDAYQVHLLGGPLKGSGSWSAQLQLEGVLTIVHVIPA